MKTVSLDDDAYDLLKGAKVRPTESFSEVVKRHFGARRGGIEATAGAWADADPDLLVRLKRERLDAFGSTRD